VKICSQDHIDCEMMKWGTIAVYILNNIWLSDRTFLCIQSLRISAANWDEKLIEEHYIHFEVRNAGLSPIYELYLLPWQRSLQMIYWFDLNDELCTLIHNSVGSSSNNLFCEDCILVTKLVIVEGCLRQQHFI
jgi:hypothetical protein